MQIKQTERSFPLPAKMARCKPGFSFWLPAFCRFFAFTGAVRSLHQKPPCLQSFAQARCLCGSEIWIVFKKTGSLPSFLLYTSRDCLAKPAFKDLSVCFCRDDQWEVFSNTEAGSSAWSFWAECKPDTS